MRYLVLLFPSDI